MKKFIKKNLKIIIAFAAGSLITTIVVYAATANSSDVWYDKSTSSAYGATKNDVQGAITELYQKAYECNNKTCPPSGPIYKHYHLSETTAEYDYYACTSGGKQCGVGISSPCTNGITDSSCVGDFKYGKWRRLSFYSNSYGQFYTYFKVKLPNSVVFPGEYTEYMLNVSLYGNYYTASASKEGNDFKVYGRNDYTWEINCAVHSTRLDYYYDPATNPFYLSKATNLRTNFLKSDDSSNSGSSAIVYCGITKDKYIWMGFLTGADSDANGKYAWTTRADEFKFIADIIYQESF